MTAEQACLSRALVLAGRLVLRPAATACELHQLVIPAPHVPQ